MHIVSTDNGHEVRIREQRVFGPCSREECEAFVLENLWADHKAGIRHR